MSAKAFTNRGNSGPLVHSIANIDTRRNRHEVAGEGPLRNVGDCCRFS